MKVSTFAAITAFICLTNGLAIRRSDCTVDDDCEGDNACLGGQCRALGDTGAQCQDNDWCKDTLACVNGVCGQEDGATTCTTDDDCDGENACLDGKCQLPGDVGATCKTNDWCKDTLACLNGVCGAESGCKQDSDCTDGKVCTDGQCIGTPIPGKCTADTDCGTGEECQNGICQATPKPVGCVCDSDCKTDEFCDNHTCKPKIPPVSLTGFGPDAISLYHVNSGAIEYNVNHGLIEKIQGSGADVSTLVTFTYGANTAGKTCGIVLDFTGAGHTISSTGSQFVDIFSSLYYATHDTHDWPNGNGRNIHLGRVQVTNGGLSTVNQDYGLKFPCPSGQTLGYELVPTGDVQHIDWTDPKEGPRVVIS